MTKPLPSRSTRQRRRRAHARIHLPHLMGHEALLVANVMQRVVDAIWRAHGQAMVHALGCAECGGLPLVDPSHCDAEFNTADNRAKQLDIQF